MSDVVNAAITLAVRAHRGQTRIDGVTPYIVHPARVAYGVLAYLPKFNSEIHDTMIAAAYLHDVLEDTEISYAMLHELFPAVADMVSALTDPLKESMPGKNRAARKAAIRTRLKGASREVRTIKIADRMDNIRDMVGMKPSFRRLYAKETMALLPEICVDVAPEIPEKARAILEPYLE